MKKILLLFFIFLLFGNNSPLKAQCYGVVNYDQSVAAIPTSSGSCSFTISTTFSNELILISYDGFNFDGDTGRGPITVDGNNATWINTAYTRALSNSYWTTAETWAYMAAAAGSHSIVCNEDGYSSSSFDAYDVNFAADFYATCTTNLLTIASLTSAVTQDSCTDGGPVTGSITTTTPNSMIYSNVLYNYGGSSSDDISWTGSTFLANTQSGNGIEGSDAYTSAAPVAPYSITATSAIPANGSCGGIDLVLVDIPAPTCISSVALGVTMTDANPSCGNSNGIISLTVTGGTSPYTYSWSASANTSSSATGLSAGTYSVTVTGTAGSCPSSGGDSTLVIILTTGGPQITPTVTANDKCNGDCNGSVTSSVTGGVSPYAFSWSPSGGTSANATGLCAGTFTITVTDNNGCMSSAAVTITQPTILTATVAITNPVCNGGTGSITATPAGGTSPYTFAWTPSGQTNATSAGITAGTYTVTVTDNNGCTATVSGTITQPVAVTVSISGPTSLCYNGTGTLTANASRGTSPYAYSWSTGGASSTLSITITSAQTYTVTVTDANGCMASATFTVTLEQPPTISVSASNSSICQGTTVSLQASATNITSPYSWQPGSMIGATVSVTPTVTTTYTVSASSACGTATATVTISVNAIPIPSFSADVSSGCAPLCIQFRDHSTIASGAINQWGWSFGNNDTLNTTAPIYCYPKSGVYSVRLTVTSDSGCSASLNMSDMITVYSSPLAGFAATPQPTTILEPTIQFTNETTDAYGIIYWSWNFGEPGDTINNLQNPSYTYHDTGTFCPVLVAVNQHGCVDTVTNCLVINPIFTCYIPDAFSPNGDGINEEFEVKGHDIRSFEMYIFDRWGAQLFHTTDLNDGWKGEVNNAGPICQQDAYVYVIYVYDPKDIRHSFMGTVNLVK